MEQYEKDQIEFMEIIGLEWDDVEHMDIEQRATLDKKFNDWRIYGCNPNQPEE